MSPVFPNSQRSLGYKHQFIPPSTGGATYLRGTASVAVPGGLDSNVSIAPGDWSVAPQTGDLVLIWMAYQFNVKTGSLGSFSPASSQTEFSLSVFSDEGVQLRSWYPAIVTVGTTYTLSGRTGNIGTGYLIGACFGSILTPAGVSYGQYNNATQGPGPFAAPATSITQSSSHMLAVRTWYSSLQRTITLGPGLTLISNVALASSSRRLVSAYDTSFYNGPTAIPASSAATYSSSDYQMFATAGWPAS